MRARVLVGGWMFAAMVSSGVASGAPPPVVDQLLDRTAVYTGDRLRYTIQLRVAAGTQLAAEDFERKNINFGPLVVDDVVTSSTLLSSGETQYRFEYLLSNYETGNKTIELPRIVFRYQAAGDAEGQRRPTEEMAVPALPIAVRSTLNQPLADSWVQESLPTSFPVRPRWLFVVVGCGVLGLLVSSLPVWSLLRRRFDAWKAGRGQPTWREFLDRWARSLDELAQAGKETDVKDRFGALQGFAREYVLQAWKLPVEGLTAEQLRTRLEDLGATANARDVLEMTVGDAQDCRYAPADATAWEEKFRKDLSDLRALATA